MNWGTLIGELLLRAGGGRNASSDVVKLAVIEAIGEQTNEHFYVNEQRFTIATVADQGAYGEGAGGSNIPQGIVRILSNHLFVDIDQDADNRRTIPRRGMDWIERARSGADYTSEPEAWSFFAQQLELWPTPDGVHDVHGRAVVEPGTPIARLESGTWKFYQPFTTSFVAGNEVDDQYPNPAESEANAWFTDRQAYSLILNYALYLLYEGHWHGTKGQGERALRRALEAKRTLETKVHNMEEPTQIEPYSAAGGHY